MAWSAIGTARPVELALRRGSRGVRIGAYRTGSPSRAPSASDTASMVER
jgi:hypothetical protein